MSSPRAESTMTNPAEIAGFVPAEGQAVVIVWNKELKIVERKRVQLGQVLAVGRAPEDAAPYRIQLVQNRRPLISRKHLMVLYDEATGWKIRHFERVLNYGWVRYWGDVGWVRADAVDLHPRRGLLAYLFPGDPPYLMTITSCDPPPRPPANYSQGGIATADPIPVPFRITPSQQTVILDALADAVCWPPNMADGHVRGWRELALAGEYGEEHYRSHYRRFVERNEATTGLPWNGSARGGVNPQLLLKLIESGDLRYATVYRQRGGWPRGRLIPTHFTHDPRGRAVTT